MWQRFSADARRAVFYAQQEAFDLGSAFVDPDHFLLGVLREPKSDVCELLAAMGVSPAGIAAQVRAAIPSQSPSATTAALLSPQAKRLIDDAYREARDAGDRYVGTDHLLLATLRLREGVAGQILDEAGVEYAACRAMRLNRETGAGAERAQSTEQPRVGGPLHDLARSLFRRGKSD